MAQTRSQTKAQEEIKGLPTPTPNLLEENTISKTMFFKIADASSIHTKFNEINSFIF